MKLMVAVLLVSLGLAPAAIADNHPSPAVTVEVGAGVSKRT